MENIYVSLVTYFISEIEAKIRTIDDYMNVVFLLAVSKSNTAQSNRPRQISYNDLIDFVNGIAESLEEEFSEDKIHAAFYSAQYSTNTPSTSEYNFVEFESTSTSQFISNIHLISSHLTHVTRSRSTINDDILYVKDKLDKHKNGRRANARDLVIIISDSMTTGYVYRNLS